MKNILYSLLLSLLIMTPAIADTIVRIAPLTTKILSSTTTVTGTAAACPATALKGRENIVLQNTDSATETVWIGDSTVTSSNGFALDSKTPSLSIDIDDSVQIFCISDGTSVNLRTLESK